MATLTTDTAGRRLIQLAPRGGRRPTIRLGHLPQRDAEYIKTKIEALDAAAISGLAPQPETAAWLSRIDDVLHAQLAKLNLVPARVKPEDRDGKHLGEFLNEYFANLSVKPGTAVAYGQTRKYLVDFFGADRGLGTIGERDADQWRKHLEESGLAKATISRRVVAARAMFEKARRWKLIDDNPFEDLKAGPQKNKARMFFITRDMAQKVLDACPNAQWRLLFALARFGGLRNPSESLLLKWTDVDWSRGRILIHSPKTEHHEGGESREIPLFAELLPILRENFEAAEPGTEYVITRYRDTTANLRTQFCRILRKAGLKPWPRLFQNLRSTRQTELSDTWPAHAVCAWLGNSERIARDHYLKVRDEHFDQAAAYGALQQPSEMPRSPSHADGEPAICDGKRGMATACSEVVGAEGFEPS